MSKSLVDRSAWLCEVERALRRAPVVALVGPRQSGKTTLARQIVACRRRGHYFDLESAEDLRALEHPERVLGELRGLVILDEIQRRPDLFAALRVLVDRVPSPVRFLVLGSASGDLLRQTSETLAGRIEYVELQGFGLDEIGARWPIDRLWMRGGFPRSFLAQSEADSFRWREQFMRTFVERDVPLLGVRLQAGALSRFWSMVAHYHGQTWNGSEIGRSLALADTTVRRYLDLLADAFVLRLLPPWFENLGKRLVKTPKVYVRDSGIFHALQGIRTRQDLYRHPRLGASWEGFALEQVLQRRGARDAYFWATHGGAELDLLLIRGPRRIGVEFKFADAPTITRSMRQALADLRLDRLYVIHPGRRRFSMEERVEAVPLDAAVTKQWEPG